MNCKKCSKLIESKYAKQFCNLSCANSYNTKKFFEKQKANKEAKLCLNCSNIIKSKYAVKFCGSSCAASYNNKLFPKKQPKSEVKNINNPSLRSFVPTLCSNCKLPVRRPKKFCNLMCQSKYRWSSRKESILSSGKERVARVAKKFLLEEKGNICSICFNSEWNSKPIPLVLDHINGNSEDNSIANLRLVCGNCDMQLPTYKSKNKGNGRAWRRQRYADGKSY
jgi:hypothetical protein